jgi:hypothetical protein
VKHTYLIINLNTHIQKWQQQLKEVYNENIQKNAQKSIKIQQCDIEQMKNEFIIIYLIIILLLYQ